jgi:Dolichyl-phosphate-mannose-protein mannosyltransferase
VKFIPVIVFSLALLLSVVTAKDYGLSWDEPLYYHASDLHMWWAAGLARDVVNGNVGRSLDDKRIQQAWHWDPYHVPHPPFSRIVSGVTHELFSPWLGEVAAYRLGPILFFSLLVTFMYLWMAELFGRGIGLLSALTLCFIPNVFGFAHFAVTDMPLASMWFLTIYSFWKGLESWRWSIVLGIVWGLALATKFPAFLIFPPIILWAHIYYRRCYANNLFCMIFIAPVVMVATQPYLWHQTAIRILEFFYEGVSRGYRTDANFPIYFLHRLLATSELPRYYPFLLTLVTTPETILCLALIGAIAAARSGAQRPVMMLFLANALFILFLGLLPGAVLHDGMRQMLAVYPFIVALSMLGFCLVKEFLGAQLGRAQAFASINNIKAKISGLLAVLIIFPPMIGLAVYHPFELSYYNRFVGGLPGASARGLEITYFMEALTPEFLHYLNRTLPPNASVNGFFANFMLGYYQAQGQLRRDLRITDKDKYDYALILNRRSAASVLPRVRELMKSRPAASVSLAGVPLVMLYKTDAN